MNRAHALLISVSLVATYGTPVLKPTIVRTELPSAVLEDAIVLAPWSDAAASLTLLRDMYSLTFR